MNMNGVTFESSVLVRPTVKRHEPSGCQPRCSPIPWTLLQPCRRS